MATRQVFQRYFYLIAKLFFRAGQSWADRAIEICSTISAIRADGVEQPAVHLKELGFA